MGENTIIGISETWLKKEDSDNLWNLHPRTHAMFRYDKQSAVKKKGGGVLLYIPVKLAPKLRPDLNLFDKEKYESVWVECKSTFNISSNEKMLVNLCYNPSRSNFIDILEQLTLNIDNAFSVSKKITLLGDYNINYLDSKEKEILDSIIIPYGLMVFVQTLRPELVPQLKLISTTLSETMKQTALNFVLIHLIKPKILFHLF